MKYNSQTRTSFPRVYVVILNWNNYEDSKACIKSVLAATYPNLKVIVVDNNSMDDSGNRLKTEFPAVLTIFNQENLGFARGCNVGIRFALNDPNCAYVLLLNNDAVVEPGFLEKAIEGAEADVSRGLIGGKMLSSLQPKTIWYAGGEVDLWAGGVKIRGNGEVDRGQYDEACEVEFVTGALMLITRKVLETVGLLPEEYFFGVEEYDYSLSVRRAGFKLYYVPEFSVYHHGDGSHWNWDPKFVYNGYRNKLIFQEKFLARPIFQLWKLVFILYSRYGARRKWLKLAKFHRIDRAVSYDDMQYALDRAICDHGKDLLTEESLKKFDEALKDRRAMYATPDKIAKMW